MEEHGLLSNIFRHLSVGVVVVDQARTIVFWNRFMAVNSGLQSDQVLGGSLYECFPDLPKAWLERQFNVVTLLKQSAFSSWEQRPFLFEFRNAQPVTADVATMRQDCTFLPVKNEAGSVESICIIVTDATEVSVYRTRLQAALAELEELSIRDGLTGVFNRRHIDHLAQVEFGRFTRYQSLLSVAMLDIDHFKAVNDVHGHVVGDEVLRNVAQRLAEQIRLTDIVGRFGGEEFLIVLPGINASQAVQAADRFREKIATISVDSNKGRINPTVSVGACEAAPRHETLSDLIRDADSALYQAKERGRNRVVLWSPVEGPTGETSST